LGRIELAHFGLVGWRTIYLRKKAQGKPAKQALKVDSGREKLLSFS